MNVINKFTGSKRAVILFVICFLFFLSCINMETTDTGGVVMPGNTIYRYLLYLPKNYARQPSRRYPLLVYLHGKSCRGYNLEKLK